MGQNWFALTPTPLDRPSASDNKMGQNGKKKKTNIPKIRAVHTSLSRPWTLWNPTETDDSAPDNTGCSQARAGDKSRRYRPPDLSSLDETLPPSFLFSVWGQSQTEPSPGASTPPILTAFCLMSFRLRKASI